MRTPHRWASLALLAILAPSIASAEDASPPDILGFVGDPSPSDGRPRSSYVKTSQVGIDRLPSVAAGGAPTIFFLNKNGGTYRPGSENSRTNNSSIVDQVSSIAPWNVSDANWATVKNCVTSMFSRWNVTITDVDPGTTTPHYELVVAGRPQDIGMESGVGGVSPFTSNCSVIPNSITYTFATVYGSAYQAICETVGQEIAHSFGLDHERLCSDPMTYMNACGAKSFQDVAASCGEYSNRACACNGNTQNSVAMLNERLGLAGTGGGDEPVVQITAPADGATVAPGFTVTASTLSGPAVARIELYIDGAFVSSDTAAPYSFVTASTLAAGSHAVEARAIAGDGGTASDSVNVTISGGGGGGGGGGGDEPDAGPGGGGGGGDEPDAGTDPGNDPGDDDGDGGYVTSGCAAHDGYGAGLVGLGLIAFAILWAWRRRRSGR